MGQNGDLGVSPTLLRAQTAARCGSDLLGCARPPSFPMRPFSLLIFCSRTHPDTAMWLCHQFWLTRLVAAYLMHDDGSAREQREREE
jgi:hypothetical protein